MPPRSRIQIAKPDIVRFFDELPNAVFGAKDLASILSEHRAEWRLTQRMCVDEFIEFLTRSSKLKAHRFGFPTRTEIRYTWGDVHFLQVVLSLKRDSYFTHYTAVRMHGLTEQVPKTIFLNYEQSPHARTQILDQEAIDAAFAKPQRQSNNIAEVSGVRVYLLNGMHTALLGVERRDIVYDDSRPLPVRVTGLERTLIDITVRPAYAGGVFEVRKAFELARETVSVNRLAAMLQKLQFAYPYHQAIGFYMERAGYKPSLIDLVRRFPTDFDFYLTHGMAEKHYVKKWRLYVPSGL
jgi:hypothetical protein